jgi:hypothetical protein
MLVADDRIMFSIGMMEEVMEMKQISCGEGGCGGVWMRVYRPLIAFIVDAGDDPCEFSRLITLRL